jgi:hypothetical protein
MLYENATRYQVTRKQKKIKELIYKDDFINHKPFFQILYNKYFNIFFINTSKFKEPKNFDYILFYIIEDIYEMIKEKTNAISTYYT